MKRKVIEIAGTTKLISLPKKWTSANGIKKGDELDININESSITIFPPGVNSFEKTEIDVSDLDELIYMVVGMLYVSGYDEIRIKFKDNSELDKIQQCIKENCIGLEIIEQGHNYVIARKISDALYESFESMLKRTFTFLSNMANESYDAVKTKTKNRLKNVIAMDRTVNSFTYFCNMVLNKKGAGNMAKTTSLFYIIDNLERIGDRFKKACSVVLEKNITPTSAMLEIHRKVTVLYNILYSTFYKFELNKLKDMANLIEEISLSIKNVIALSGKNESIYLAHLYVIADIIRSMKGNLLIYNSL